MNSKNHTLTLITLSLLGSLTLLTTLSILINTAAASADATVRYVAPGKDCGGAVPCYASTQAAVDAAADGDETRIAQGTYTGVNNNGGLPQVVYINKSVTLRGGYTPGDWNHADPDAHPTTIDAQAQGRGIYIEGSITVALSGLRISGGDATRLEGDTVWVRDAGGGLYAYDSHITMLNNTLTENTGAAGGDTGMGQGGGMMGRSAPAR